MKKIKFLIVALIATFAFASCSEDEPAKMLWEVSATPSENVKAAFDPNFYAQIQISTNGEVSEVTLKCTNYQNMLINGDKNENGEYVDKVCYYTAKVTAPGEIRISFNKIPDHASEVHVFSYLMIEGNDGKSISHTTVQISRNRLEE